MIQAMTKKRSKNETKRQQILSAAINLFVEQGYSATSMEQIAKNADVSKQTVYSHFGNKDDLFSASIEQKCESLHILDLSMHDLSDPQDILFQLAQRIIDIIVSKQTCAVHKICAFESNTYPQVSNIYYQSGPLRVTNEITQLLEKLHQQKILTIENPRHAALQFLNMMKGELWMQIEFNTKERISSKEVDEYLRDSVAFFIRGYAAVNKE